MFTVLLKNRPMSAILIAALGFMLIITLAVISPVTAPTHTTANDQQSLAENKGNVIKPLSADAFPQYHQSEWSLVAIPVPSMSTAEVYYQSERTLIDPNAGRAIYLLSEHTLVDPLAGLATYFNSERTSLPVGTASEPRLWSGEVFLSDNSNPDYEVNLQSGAKQDLQNQCISEDSLPRRYGGCVE